MFVRFLPVMLSVLVFTPPGIVFSQTLTVTNPASSTEWIVGEEVNIEWSSTGTVTSVGIQVKPEQGGKWTSISPAPLPNSGSYSWVVPQEASGISFYLRIYDPANTVVADTAGEPGTPAVVMVVEPSNEPYIEVLTPNGGDTLFVGSPPLITWKASESITFVSIDLSFDMGETWTPLGNSESPRTSSEPFDAPYLETSDTTTQALVRISNYFDSTTYDISDSAFTVLLPQLTVESPSEAEIVTVGSPYVITWTALGFDPPFKVFFSPDSGKSFDLLGATSADTFLWVPDEGQITDKARISVTTYTNSNRDTGHVFSVVAESPDAMITITTPNSEDTWLADTKEVIRWSREGDIAGVNISLSSDGGATWEGVALAISDDSVIIDVSEQWISDQVRVRVMSSDGSVSDTSELFSVSAPTPAITILTPSPSDTLQGATEYDITWATQGVDQELALEVSYGSSAWEILADSLEVNTVAHTWTIPQINTDSVLIRIRTVDNTIAAQLSSPFSIRSPVRADFVSQYPNYDDRLELRITNEGASIFLVISKPTRVAYRLLTLDGKTVSGNEFGILDPGVHRVPISESPENRARSAASRFVLTVRLGDRELTKNIVHLH